MEPSPGVMFLSPSNVKPVRVPTDVIFGCAAVVTVPAVVAVAAFPVVSWSPVVFTPGRFISAVPLKLTPPIFLAVSKAVAVAALPVQDPELPETLPVTSPVTLPVKAPANPSAVKRPELGL